MKRMIQTVLLVFIAVLALSPLTGKAENKDYLSKIYPLDKGRSFHLLWGERNSKCAYVADNGRDYYIPENFRMWFDWAPNQDCILVLDAGEYLFVAMAWCDRINNGGLVVAEYSFERNTWTKVADSGPCYIGSIVGAIGIVAEQEPIVIYNKIAGGKDAGDSSKFVLGDCIHDLTGKVVCLKEDRAYSYCFLYEGYTGFDSMGHFAGKKHKVYNPRIAYDAVYGDEQ